MDTSSDDDESSSASESTPSSIIPKSGAPKKRLWNEIDTDDEEKDQAKDDGSYIEEEYDNEEECIFYLLDKEASKNDKVDHLTQPPMKKPKLVFLVSILSIPTEVMFYNIWSYLDIVDLFKTRLVCKQFNTIIENQWLGNNNNCKFIPKCSYTDIDGECNFTNVIINGESLNNLFESDQIINFYSKFKNVMNFYGYKLIDPYLLTDISFTGLNSLYLVNCGLTGADIYTLSQSNHLINLKSLCLDSNKLRGNGNLNLLVDKCPNIETLAVSFNLLSDECTTIFDDLKKLHTLIINNNNITINGQLHLLLNKTIKILSIDGSSQQFNLNEPLSLNYLQFIRGFHCNQICSNTIVSKDFPIIDNYLYLEYSAVKELILNNPSFKYHYNCLKSIDSSFADKYYYMNILKRKIKSGRYKNSETEINLMGEIYEKKKKWTKAIKYYNDCKNYSAIASIYYILLNYEKALSYYLKTNQTTYNENIAICYYHLRDFKNAIKYFDALPYLSSDLIVEYCGVAYYHCELYEKSIENLSKLNNPSSDAKYDLAYALLERKESSRAIEILNNLVTEEIKPAITLLASIYEKGLYNIEKDSKKAIEIYSKLENDHECILKIGKIYYFENDLENAIKYLKNITKCSTEACYLMGCALQNSNLEESLNNFVKVLTRSSSCEGEMFKKIYNLLSDYVLDSISYDWSFTLDFDNNSTNTSITMNEIREYFERKFLKDIMIERIKSTIIGFDPINLVYKLIVSPSKIAKLMFISGNYEQALKFYNQVATATNVSSDDIDQAERYILFYTWMNNRDPEKLPLELNDYCPSILIEKHLHYNIYAKCLYSLCNVSKQYYDDCKHILSYEYFDIIQSIYSNDTQFIEENIESNYPNYIIELIINHSIKHDLTLIQEKLLNKLGNIFYSQSIENLKSILKCLQLDRNNQEQDLVSLLREQNLNSLSYLKDKLKNPLYTNIVDFKTKFPQTTFESALIWGYYSIGDEQKVLNWLESGYSNSSIYGQFKNIISNMYDPIDVVISMFNLERSHVIRQIYLHKHPKLEIVFNSSYKIDKLISNLLEEKLITLGDANCKSIFNQTLNRNSDCSDKAELAFSLGLGKMATKYYEHAEIYSNVGHTYCQGFTDLPINYNTAIKYFLKARKKYNNPYYSCDEEDIERNDYNLGCCYLSIKEYDTAIANFEETSFNESKIYMAKCYICKGGSESYEKAARYLGQVNVESVLENHKFLIGKCYSALSVLHNTEYGRKAIEIFKQLPDNTFAQSRLRELKACLFPEKQVDEQNNLLSMFSNFFTTSNTF